jgi:hypothetical protein
MYHCISIAFDAMPVEGRLDKAALLAVEISVARQKTITKQETKVTQTGLYEVAGFLNQEVAHMFRTEEQHNLLLAKVDCGHAAVCLLHFTHKM